MLALQDMADQDLFICPRCTSPVHVDNGSWHCSSASCRYAEEAFPVVAGVPALVDFEHSVLDADRLRAAEGASEVQRRSLPAPLRHLMHPANTTAPANVARMVDLLRADAGAAGRRPRVLVVGGGAVGDGLGDLYADTVDRPDLLRRLQQPRRAVHRRRPLDPARRRQRGRGDHPGGAGARAGADRRRPGDPPGAPRPAASSTRTRRSSSRCTRAPTTSPGSPTAATGSSSAASSGSTPARWPAPVRRCAGRSTTSSAR